MAFYGNFVNCCCCIHKLYHGKIHELSTSNFKLEYANWTWEGKYLSDVRQSNSIFSFDEFDLRWGSILHPLSCSKRLTIFSSRNLKQTRQEKTNSTTCFDESQNQKSISALSPYQNRFDGIERSPHTVDCRQLHSGQSVITKIISKHPNTNERYEWILTIQNLSLPAKTCLNLKNCKFHRIFR